MYLQQHIVCQQRNLQGSRCQQGIGFSDLLVDSSSQDHTILVRIVPTKYNTDQQQCMELGTENLQDSSCLMDMK